MSGTYLVQGVPKCGRNANPALDFHHKGFGTDLVRLWYKAYQITAVKPILP